MMASERDVLINQLLLHEGLKLIVYNDSLGIPTIGCGRNIRDKGITKAEALYLLDNDLDECIVDLAHFGWFVHLDPVRQIALIDLRFNLGPAKFRRFVKMLDALERYDFPTAADELQGSAWSAQVQPGRVMRLTSQLRTGVTV